MFVTDSRSAEKNCLNKRICSCYSQWVAVDLASLHSTRRGWFSRVLGDFLIVWIDSKLSWKDDGWLVARDNDGYKHTLAPIAPPPTQIQRKQKQENNLKGLKANGHYKVSHTK